MQSSRYSEYSHFACVVSSLLNILVLFIESLRLCLPEELQMNVQLVFATHPVFWMHIFIDVGNLDGDLCRQDQSVRVFYLIRFATQMTQCTLYIYSSF